MTDVRPLTPDLLDELGKVLRGGWGSSCWCMFPRLTDAQTRGLPGDGPVGERRRVAMTKLAGRTYAPGLVTFQNEEPVGWIAVAPRTELGRVVASRAAPPVDDQAVWVIPCVTVKKTARGRGIAVAAIQAAVAYAVEHGASIVEAYPRAGEDRTDDEKVYFGTEPMFRRAGFHVVRQPLSGLPSNWVPRVAMRAVIPPPATVCIPPVGDQ